MRAVQLALLAVGAWLRVARFLEPRPLWLDEALIALNILSRSPADLSPLQDSQIAPLGFLWGEWLVTRVAGTGELALRFIPLVASVFALWAFAKLAERLLDARVALFATALAAVSPILVYYSAEVKSYAFDWLLAILLMHVTLDLLADPSRSNWRRWTVVAASGSLVSVAAPFVTAGSALALVTDAGVRDRGRGVVKVLVASLPAAGIALFHLLTIYRSTDTTSFMQVYWSDAFLQFQFRGLVTRVTSIVYDMWSSVLFDGGFTNLLPRKTMTVLLLLSITGTVSLAVRSPTRATLLLAPAVLAALASFVQLWPLTPRLLLFAVPIVIVTLPEGLATVARLIPVRAQPTVLLPPSVALVLASGLGVDPQDRAGLRFVPVPGALRDLQQGLSDEQAVYFSGDLRKACIYYLRWHPDREALGGSSTVTDCAPRGTHSVVGEWPQFVQGTAGASSGAPRAISPEWLEKEGGRILGQPADEVTLLFGYARELRDALPAWLEQAGATRVSRAENHPLLILRYRLPPR